MATAACRPTRRRYASARLCLRMPFAFCYRVPRWCDSAAVLAVRCSVRFPNAPCFTSIASVRSHAAMIAVMLSPCCFVLCTDARAPLGADRDADGDALGAAAPALAGDRLSAAPHVYIFLLQYQSAALACLSCSFPLRASSGSVTPWSRRQPRPWRLACSFSQAVLLRSLCVSQAQLDSKQAQHTSAQHQAQLQVCFVCEFLVPLSRIVYCTLAAHFHGDVLFVLIAGGAAADALAAAPSPGSPS